MRSLNATIISTICLLQVVLLVDSGFGQQGNIIVLAQNRLNEFRKSETVSIGFRKVSGLLPLSDGSKVAVYSVKSGKYIPSQAIDYSGDGIHDELIFQADFDTGETQKFFISDGQKTADIKPQYPAYATYVPQRKDDFAWENDRIAFRVYGPELQRTELVSSGIDIWVKSVKYPVINDWYSRGHDYYHRDHGEGLDFYTVGTTLGCGGLGVWQEGKLCKPENYKIWKMISAGPIRSVFELTYKPFRTAGKTASETRRISLDLGSNLNRIESRFDVDFNDIVFAAAIAKNSAGGHLAVGGDKTWMTYWQNPDANNGSIGCAVILGHAATRNQTAADPNHNFLLAKTDAAGSLTYYAGACWSKIPDFNSEEKWNHYVEHRARCLESPLIIKVLDNNSLLRPGK